jgi:hypothetical protein
MLPPLPAAGSLTRRTILVYFELAGTCVPRRRHGTDAVKDDGEKIAALRKRAKEARRKYERCAALVQVASQEHRERLTPYYLDLKSRTDEAEASLAAAEQQKAQNEPYPLKGETSAPSVARLSPLGSIRHAGADHPQLAGPSRQAAAAADARLRTSEDIH